MSESDSSRFIFYMLTLFISGSLLFLVGFFPATYNLVDGGGGGHGSGRPSNLDDISLVVPSKSDVQVILMLIDGLRVDFPTVSNMPYTHNNSCAHSKLRVDIPTVTMPRLKSLTTGTISNFIDLVLNIGQASPLNDSVLHRLKSKGDIAVFAGDRTWIDLFPTQFHRKFPNTDSFFVNDFHEGDKNVTRALKRELAALDWHLLVVHYLGLDHIGHVEGSESEKIKEKLHEMDDVVHHIISAPHYNRRMILLTGDHGMRVGGGHGGSTTEEVYVPLILLHGNCTTRKRNFDVNQYNQIDLAPSMAILLDVEIPTTSIGGLIPELLQWMPMGDQLYAYYYNAQHLLNKSVKKLGLTKVQESTYYKWFVEAKAAHKQFLLSEAGSTYSFEKAKQNYARVARHISIKFSTSLVQFDYDKIAIALALCILSALNLLLTVLFDQPSPSLLSKSCFLKRFFLCLFIAAGLNVCCHYIQYLTTASYWESIMLTLPITASLYLAGDVSKLIVQILLPLSRKAKVRYRLSIPPVLLAFFLFHTFSFISTSMIEEEHQTWYYLTPTLLLSMCGLNYFNNVRKSMRRFMGAIDIFVLWRQVWPLRFAILTLVTLRFCRCLNQTGDKWIHLQDIGDILVKPEYKTLLSVVLVLALLLLLRLLHKYNSPLQMVACVIALFSVYCYRDPSYTSSIMIYLFFASVAVVATARYRKLIWSRRFYGYDPKLNLVELLETNLTCSLLLAALLHKPHNVILVPSLLFTLEHCYQLCNSLYLQERQYNRSYVLVLKTVLTIFIAKMFYFFQGNSNSLSTIDLNPGYIGQSTYNPLVVGILVTMNTYSAPINAFLCLVLHMFRTQCESLPMRQEKEQFSNKELLQSTERDMQLVIGLFAATTVLPVAVYWILLVYFRYHYFIYSVFAPKAFYECFHVIVFYLNFIITSLYFTIFE